MSSLNSFNIEVIEMTIKKIYCTGCPLDGKSIKVKDIGSRKSGVVFIGEAPGTEEIAEGRPFVGRSGKLLDRLLPLLGIDRKDVIIGNAVKCMIARNTPSSIINDALKYCRPFIEKTLRLAKPELVILLGERAMK